jgi:hypothetical protein
VEAQALIPTRAQAGAKTRARKLARPSGAVACLGRGMMRWDLRVLGGGNQKRPPSSCRVSVMVMVPRKELKPATPGAAARTRRCWYEPRHCDVR